MAEQGWIAEENTGKLGEVLALRALAEFRQSEFTQAFSTAKQALDLLPEQHWEWRGIMLLHLAAGEFFSGNITAAHQLAQEAHLLLGGEGNEYAQRALTRLLGEIKRYQGNLYEADQIFRQLLNESSDHLGDKVHALIGLGSLSLEANHLDAADHYATQSYDLAEQWGDSRTRVDSAILLAQVKQAKGDITQAQQILRLHIVSEKAPILGRELRVWEAWLALTSGDITAVKGWYASQIQYMDSAPILLQEREALVIARLWIAEGEIEAALRLLDQWEHHAHDCGRIRSKIEALNLKAVAFWTDKRLPQTKATLAAALTLAQNARYVRLFLQEGEVMSSLLREVVRTGNKGIFNYIQNLLTAFAQEQAKNEMASYLALIPANATLSPQEQQVFHLLGEGLSNSEIAIELAVSVNTVKTQLKSIYRKLGITNRKDARKMAKGSSLR